ncbi:MAG: ATPase domain-containing protein [Nanoarchaeota archaeon]
MKKIKTGIPGLDTILHGGINETSFVLVSGIPGTGKTIFGLQFLIEGIMNKEKGLMICTEESVQAIKNHAAELNIDLDDYEKKKLLYFVQQPISDKKLLSLATPMELIKKEKIRRVVLDSLTLFKYMHVAGTMDFRKELWNFITLMKEAGITLIVTAERETAGLDNLQFRSYDFLFDGVILLTHIRKGASYERCIAIQKMRGQSHSLNIYPFMIKEGGITIYPDQPPFSLMEQDTRSTQ